MELDRNKPESLKSAEAWLLRLWELGLDTKSIAIIAKIDESDVYNSLSRIRCERYHEDDCTCGMPTRQNPPKS